MAKSGRSAATTAAAAATSPNRAPEPSPTLLRGAPVCVPDAETAASANDAEPETNTATGVLFVVATPLGNLEDVSARALRVLRECDLIAAEDTRVTRKLLAHFDIHSPLTAYHAHSDPGRANGLLEQLAAGKRIALVSDAGTPVISDPGAELVAEAVARGVRIEPIPGPSAVLAALVASGLPCARWVFEGFLPRTRGDRWERVREVCREPRTVVLYEAPTRLVETLDELAKAAGPDRRVVVARELTKKFEQFVRGTLAEVSDHFRATPPRGECTLVLDGADPAAAGAAPDAEKPGDPETLLKDALGRGLSPRDAARDIARTTGQPRNVLYALALRLKNDSGP